MAVREFQGISFEDEELKAFQQMLDGMGANLLDRLFISVATQYEDGLHDPDSNLERLRFCQGGLEYGGRLTNLINVFRKYQTPFDDSIKEEAAGEEAEPPELRF